MRDYGKVYTALWRSKKFRGLPSDDCRLLYLYLHTCPHANMLGCFVLDEGYALSDLGWTAKRYREGIDILSKAHLIGFDRSENLVRIVDFIKHDPFSNPKHAIAAVKMAEKLPDCQEKQRLIADLAQAKHVNPAALKDTLSIPYRYQEPEPEPEQEQEEEMGKPISRQTANHDACIDHFNSVAARVGWAQVQKVTAQRKAALAHRITDCGGPEAWCSAIDRAATSPLLTGQTARGWRATFDWLITASNFTKLMEGNYDPRPDDNHTTHRSGPGGAHDSMVAAFAGVARRQ